MGVCSADEAAQLLAALEPDDQVAYALAFYAGLRRAEIHRLTRPDVDLDGFRLHVRRAKSEAGSDRRPPIAQTPRPSLRAAWTRRASQRTAASPGLGHERAASRGARPTRGPRATRWLERTRCTNAGTPTHRSDGRPGDTLKEIME